MRSAAMASVLFALSALALARVARAQQCNTDLDCYGPACGDAVCQYSVSGHTCVPAGTDPQGYDGFCMSDSDCKCLRQGATCPPGTMHCTFTLPQDAGAPAAAPASGGSAGSGSGGEGGCAVGRAASADGAALAAMACGAAVVVWGRRRSRREPG